MNKLSIIVVSFLVFTVGACGVRLPPGTWERFNLLDEASYHGVNSESSVERRTLVALQERFPPGEPAEDAINYLEMAGSSCSIGEEKDDHHIFYSCEYNRIFYHVSRVVAPFSGMYPIDYQGFVTHWNIGILTENENISSYDIEATIDVQYYEHEEWVELRLRQMELLEGRMRLR